MLNRKVLKARGRVAFKANYWKSVLVAFLATIGAGTPGASTGFRAGYDLGSSEGLDQEVTDIINGLGKEELLALLGVTAGIFIIVFILSAALSILVLNPLSVGTSNFFLQNRADHGTTLGTLERGFTPNYGNIVLVQFMKNLFINLWALLFVIPGIIKRYQYFLVDYLLAENSEMNYKEALETSKRLMDGQKWHTFVLDLSFIGWLLLGVISFGIVNALYTQPFMEATHAELYMALAHPENPNPLYDDGEKEDVQTVEFVVEEVEQQ